MATAVRSRRSRRRSIEVTDPAPQRGPGRSDGRANETKVKKLCDALLAGNSYKNSARLANVAESTFWRWMQEGETAEEGSLARTFYERVEKACAEAEHRNVMVIQKASGKSWQAAAWWLERRNPEEYGRKDRVDVGNAGNNPFLTGNVGEHTLNDEEKLAALRGILSRKPDLKLAIEGGEETPVEE